MIKGKSFAFAILIGVATGSAQAQSDIFAQCSGNDPNRAVTACTQALATPNLPAARIAVFSFNRGYNLYRLGRISEAISDYNQAISANPTNPQFYNNRGFAHKALGQFDFAIADFTKAIELDPKSHVFHYNRGLAYEDRGNFAAAVPDFAKSIEISETFVLGHVALGRTLLKLGRNDEALASFARTVKQFPQNAFVYNERAKILLELRRYDEAISDFTMALQFDPRNVFALHGRGTAYLERNDLQRAAHDLTAALAINPRYAAAYVDRGNVQFRAEQYTAAIEDYTAALSLQPSLPFAYNNRATARRRLGQHAEALIDYTQALALNPRYAEAYSNRGETYLLLGDYDRAVADFRQATLIAPQLEAARVGFERAERARSARIAAQPAQPAPPAVVATAPQPHLSVLPPATAGNRRVALVIGNARYENTPALTNPVNDATDVSAALRRLNFEVIEGKDLNKQGMDDAFRRFARVTRDADLALFFYAGHAMQFQGVNYLMPIDAKLRDEADLPYEMSKLSDVMEDMARVKGVRIAIIDACRDNPLEQKLKRSIARTRGGNTRGLAPIEKAEGSIVVFATQAGAVAEDGTGRNSPFTEALLRHIEVPSLEVGILFRRVAGQVREATRGAQFPEISLSLVGEVYLKQN